MKVADREIVAVVRAALERGQRVRLTATGSSMRPFIHNGDVVELAPIDGSLARGDIVLARPAEGRYVIHRVVRAEASGVWLRGDAQRESEGPLPRRAALGRAVAAARSGRVRALDRGGWRVAGRLWMTLHPLGARLLWMADATWRTAAFGLRQMRRSGLWRAWIRRFCPDFAIQEATSQDLAVLDARFAPYDAPTSPATQQATHPRLTTYVAKHGEDALGVASHMRHAGDGAPYVGHWLYGLVVRPRYRGLGIGEALVRHVIDAARAEGASQLTLTVHEDNAPALALYRKLGFAPTASAALKAALAADAEKHGPRIALVKPL